MTAAFGECAANVLDLRQALLELEAVVAELHLPSLSEREWYRLLHEKLVPQVTDSNFLVAAVCGGTNIGKSVVFNHVAGTQASAVSPLASGTKHPVCLVPESFSAQHDLAAVFPGFELQVWESSEAALRESEHSLLFWRHDASLPENLLVLDSPDIDSDARVNWARADMIRRVADVLIGVLTQQKYNDAAVKEFFRRAASEDKAVIVVINQVHLPDDEPYWPLWLSTFCDETGINPQAVYLLPHDRAAANQNRLRFLERQWPVSDAEAAMSIEHGSDRLRVDLSALRFDEIKLRTLGGSLRLLLAPSGAAGYLDEIRSRSAEYQTAGELLATHELAEIDSWPGLPNAVLVQKMRAWWQSERTGWAGALHGFYNRIGTELAKVYQVVQERIAGPSIPPLKQYQDKEWDAVLSIVSSVYDRLNWFLELGNPLLKPRLEALLGATSREDLIATLKAKHAEWDPEVELERLIADELTVFRAEKPQWFQMLKHLDAVAAAARPVTSIALFVTGFGPVGNVVGHIATDAAVTSVVHVATDVVAGSLAATVGESWLASGTATAAAWIEARFRRMHEQFAQRRGVWLAGLLQEFLLGTLPQELQAAARLPDSPEFERVAAALSQLARFSEPSTKTARQ